MTLTAAQEGAQQVLAGPATHIMGEGGSRSGKTFLFVRGVATRAIKAPRSKHAIFRFRFNHIKSSIILGTFPKVMEVCFPQVPYDLNKTDWYATLPNGSEIWFGGLDDKARTEKVLGNEFVTIYLNEISQIAWESRNLAVTRLAQKVDQVVDGIKRPMPVRMYYDLNPTGKGHWGYKVFHENRDPDTKQLMPNPKDFAHFKLNPKDNMANLSESYLRILGGLSSRGRKRFLEGEWADENPNALFSDTDIDRWRVIDGKLPDMVRIVVAVDPSGSGDEDNADNDAIGIVVVGLGTDGRAYVLEDLTVKAGPGTWGKVATDAFVRHNASAVIGESNFGGDMVRFVIQTARARTTYKEVKATRGKVVRAEPFSALYEQGKVCHVGGFAELEDELTSFSTHGYLGENSPNRADALIWALTELFPGLTKGDESPEDDQDPMERALKQRARSGGWAS